MLGTKRGKIGILLLSLSIIMFIIGISAFTQKGITKFHSIIGQFSFIFWLPIFIMGIIFCIISLFNKK